VSAWRQARAIALLPGTVAVVLPAIILIAGSGSEIGRGLGEFAAGLLVALGAGLITAGLALWLWTVRLFARIGQGTLAPWDPTGHLVAEGPYAHVRNPMISAVLAALLGEAAVFGSPGILILAGAFVVVNHGYLLLHEEPGLERRFGDEYREYKRAVPRWIPRSRPWAATR
jgi:protein-S-isoprenylcysteine O-methyltransferase Ste14